MILSDVLHQIDAVASLQTALSEADLGNFQSFMAQIASHWAELGRGQGVEVIVMQDAPEHLLPSASENAARILTEAVTNALEHAFPNRREGRIEVAAYINDDGLMCLSVADDGVGMAGTPCQGQGTEIIRGLAEGLGGRAHWSSGPKGGATLLVTLPLAADHSIINGTGTHANG